MASHRGVVRLAIAVCAALVLACGGIGIVSSQASAEALLASAKSRWAARTFRSYELRLVSGSGCKLEIEVRDEAPSRIIYQEPCTAPSRSVSDLFNLVERSKAIRTCQGLYCSCRNIIELYADYDEEFGYPTRIAVRGERVMNWQESGFWRYLLSQRRLPDCDMPSDWEIVSVRQLTPLP